MGTFIIRIPFLKVLSSFICLSTLSEIQSRNAKEPFIGLRIKSVSAIQAMPLIPPHFLGWTQWLHDGLHPLIQFHGSYPVRQFDLESQNLTQT